MISTSPIPSSLTTTMLAHEKPFETNNPAFSDVFSSMFDSINHYQEHADQQIRRVELGESGAGIDELMVSVQKATVSLQLGVQVRNKMIAAYNEVMNMSV
ncbi:flagellar hook-basal body complex protein FliE [Rosenbergiella australiborealis]|uniref:flagellar hook-basal body complex protein FliE n=1 Tax=Rosenbergiella australiborealis TaxID=1544696 RepID=UPI001F4D8952|nr:flagellar hook-basal body complex protein FliE [Rosenbergiella australiborealis]